MRSAWARWARIWRRSWACPKGAALWNPARGAASGLRQRGQAPFEIPSRAAISLPRTPFGFGRRWKRQKGSRFGAFLPSANGEYTNNLAQKIPRRPNVPAGMVSGGFSWREFGLAGFSPAPLPVLLYRAQSSIPRWCIRSARARGCRGR